MPRRGVGTRSGMPSCGVVPSGNGSVLAPVFGATGLPPSADFTVTPIWVGDGSFRPPAVW